MLICECGELIEGDTFRDFIKTRSNPSTPTIGHTNCGYIFNFIDDKNKKKYSSKIELKSHAKKIAEMNKLTDERMGHFLKEIDRLKSNGNLTDRTILLMAYQRIMNYKQD